MVYKEEVFSWFKEQSGAKRIELMCGLMSMCIPLEIRFFESIIKELAKKDMNALREAELKANSYQELDTICKCDLLADTHVMIESNDLKSNQTANCEVQSNAIQSKHAIANPLPQPSQPTLQMLPQMADMQSVAPNGTAVMVQNDMIGLVPPPTPSPPNSSSHLSQLSSRSKLIVSLCLLSPTNRNCSAITFKALRQQLTAQNIASAVSRCLPYKKSVLEMEDLFSGIILLMTMAVHSQAFSFEQRELLTKQKEDVEHTIDGIKFRHNQNYSSNIPFQTYVHPGHPTHAPHIHPHIGAHPTQAHTPPAGVVTGGQAAHSHSHANVGQYGAHPYMPAIPVTNLSYPPSTLPNMTNLRISNITVPTNVSTSPTNSPSTKSTVTSVATISPLPMNAEFVTHTHGLSDSVPNQTPYVIPTQPSLPHQTVSVGDDLSCAKSIVSCYNCGSMGHRGDECNTQAQEEANR